MKRFLFLCVLATSLCAANANAEVVTFTKLTGVTGGSPAGTAVYRADLSGLTLTEIMSITIMDDSSMLGGAAGQFSGFDLDAIILSNTSVGSAAAAQALTGLSVFNYAPSGTLFSPGTQRAPTHPKLFGTDAGGTNVDNSVATLGSFDGDSSTTSPDGFLSMGDDGAITFNLTSAVDTDGLFMYIGEVGDNGEVAAGTVMVNDFSAIPEPTSFLMFGAVLGLGLVRRRRRG